MPALSLAQQRGALDVVLCDVIAKLSKEDENAEGQPQGPVLISTPAEKASSANAAQGESSSKESEEFEEKAGRSRRTSRNRTLLESDEEAAGDAPDGRAQAAIDSSDDEGVVEDDSDYRSWNAPLWSCEWSSGARKVRKQHLAAKGGPKDGVSVAAHSDLGTWYPHLAKPLVESAAKAYLDLPSAEKEKHFRKLAAVSIIEDPDHPAVADSRLHGRKFERMVVSRGIVAGQLIGEYTGDVRTDTEMADLVAAHPEGLGALFYDKQFGIDSTYIEDDWPEGLIVDGSDRGNGLRYMNHSEGEGANCRVLEFFHRTTGSVHLLVFAEREVAAGAELFLDYGRKYWRAMKVERHRAAALLERERTIEQLKQTLEEQLEEIQRRDEVIKNQDEIIKKQCELILQYDSRIQLQDELIQLQKEEIEQLRLQLQFRGIWND